ncbi:MAG: Gfo/Idh/MocA family oxidoreductase [Armatimonadetes bacterium]|nr:Gfo/Idh/MocA family oxidoreductase [Armatimonadota bacterium]
MEPVRFAIVGAGWRTEFFLRAAQALPDRFAVSSVLVRDADKAKAFGARWGVPTVASLDELAAGSPAFVVVSVPWPVTPVMLADLAERGIPALAETPPAPDLMGLRRVCELAAGGARLQVAEQYCWQPMHAAREAVVASGRLGSVSQAQVSVAHGYHGVSLLRRLLGVRFEGCRITARGFVSPLVAGPGRDGPPSAEHLEQAGQTIAWLDYGDKLGVFDFTGSQYFSWVRSPRVLVRGERGEISNTTVRWLSDFRTPHTAELLRRDAGHDGNLEGMYHKGIELAGEWVYRNPAAPGRLSDDEIAVATCLAKMADYAAGGPSFYSVAEAAQDHYLGMMIDRAAASGEVLGVEPQAWAKDG